MGIKLKKLSKFLLAIFLFLPLAMNAGDFQFNYIKTADDLPEEFSRHCEKGDLLVTDGEFYLLVGGTPRIMKSALAYYPNTGAKGNILSFVPVGENIHSNLDIGAPRINIKGKSKNLTYNAVKAIDDKNTDESFFLEATAVFGGTEGEKAEIKTIYRFYSGKGMVDITSIIKNTGKDAFDDFGYSLHFDAYHRYNFSPFHSTKHPKLGYRTYQKQGHYMSWIDETLPAREKGLLPGSLLPGHTFEVEYKLLVDVDHEKMLSHVYDLCDMDTENATIHLEDFTGDVAEIIVEEVTSSTVFFQMFGKIPSSIKVPLPQGLYSVRAHLFPAIHEEMMVVGYGTESECVIQDNPKGSVHVKIRNNEGKYVPGKITFMGLDPTRTPYFQPEDPIVSGRAWETFKNSRYPPEEGMDVKLPQGTYLIHCSRGPEYSIDKKVVEVLEGTHYDLEFHIDRVLETEKLISIDPHMHTRFSDGRISIPERIKSVVVEGVDVAAATDHNIVVDYTPTLKKLGLDPYLAVIVGNEVSTSNLIHYNTYPVTLRKDEENFGAIDPAREEVSPLFEASRKKDPEAIIQVNHPRAGNIGYFNNYRLDEETGVPGRDNFDLSFDVFEVMNGPCLYRAGNHIAIEDWLNLIGRGYYFPLIGSSDSHVTDKKEPGYSRTYVYYEGGEGENLDWPALAEAIKKGHSFTSNGPILDFRINDRYKPGDRFTTSNGKVDIRVKVECAPWISVDEVRIIVNGERKIVFPVEASEEAITKFDELISLDLEEDAFIVVEVFGEKSLYPVLQEANRGYENASFPYALTNPIFVDVDKR
jgi:predicted metal-dependent phosphoesterase TrpH